MSRAPAEAHPIRTYLDALERQCVCIAEVIERAKTEALLHISWNPSNPRPTTGFTDWTGPTSCSEFQSEAIRLHAIARAATYPFPTDVRATWSCWLDNLQAEHMALMKAEDEKNWWRMPVHIVNKRAEIVRGVQMAWRALDGVMEGKINTSAPGESETTGRAAADDRKKATVNARMIDVLGKIPDAIGWTCKKWSEHLKCSPPAIVGTTVWKSMKLEREKGKAERASKKAREKRKL